MRDLDEQTITAAVLERFAQTPSPRLKTVITSFVSHLHDFVRDVDLTFDEWNFAIDFLTRTGQMCDDKRQEFILLSDTLGVSMLVDAINHRMPEGATQTTVLGPFYVVDPPELPNGSDIAHGADGEPLLVEGIVTTASGVPIAGACVDVWHSDDDGFYDVQRSDLTTPTFRARFRSGSDGRFSFWSILPQSYPIPSDGPVGDMLRASNRHPFRPAHVHFMISAPGYEMLITHVFVAGDQYLDSDAVFGVKTSLIRDYTKEVPGIAPGGRHVSKPWRKLEYVFGLKSSLSDDNVVLKTHAQV